VSSAIQITTSSALTPGSFGHSRYLLRKQFFKIFGSAFHIYDANGGLAFYSKLKAFKLKEDVRVYTGEDMQTELLCIKARSILDFGATYDVVDSATGEKLGALRRKGFKSILKDEWVILDASDAEVGLITEDSLLLALVRRFLTQLVPQTFLGNVAGAPVFTFKQHFNPFVQKIDLDFSSDAGGLLDRRMGIAAGVMMCAIEGRQSGS
jgi:uncharacterized protein YxjI